MVFLLAGVQIAAALLEPAAGIRFQYERAAVSGGQWWRLFCGQMVHTGALHLSLNLSGLLLVPVIFGRYYGTRSWVLGLVAGLAAVGGGLFWGSPQIEWYRGFSGVLHGWFVMGLLGGHLKGNRVCRAGLLLMAVKLAGEALVGPAALSTALIGAPVVGAAHLYGAGSGALVGGLCSLQRVAPRATIDSPKA